jgi:hypothetical protein
MFSPHEIEQLLREGFPFAKQWFFNCTDGCAYYLQGEGEDSIALHRYQRPEPWGAKLEDAGCWILSASEGSTPEEAVSNLQVAIAQLRRKTGEVAEVILGGGNATNNRQPRNQVQN